MFSRLLKQRPTLVVVSILATLAVVTVSAGLAIKKVIEISNTNSKSTEMTLFVHLTSTDGRYDQRYLGNYAVLHIQPELARTEHVESATVVGRLEDSLRLWLDTDRLKKLNVTVEEVIGSIRDNDMQVTTVRNAPTVSDERLTVTIPPAGSNFNPELLGDIIVQVNTGGQAVRLRDVARIEFAATSPDVVLKLDGRTAVGTAVHRRPKVSDATASVAVRATMQRLKRDFPPSLDFTIIDDPNRLVEESTSTPAASSISTAALSTSPTATSPAQN